MVDEEAKKIEKKANKTIAEGWKKLHEGIGEFSNLLDIKHPEFEEIQKKIALFIISFYCIAAVSREQDSEKCDAYQRLLLQNIQETIVQIAKQDKNFAENYSQYMKKVTGLVSEPKIEDYRIMKPSPTIH